YTLTGNLNPTNPTVVVIGGGHNLFMGPYSSNNITYIFTGNPPGSLASSSNVNLTGPSTGSLSGIAAYQVASTSCTHSACDTWNDTGSYTIQVTGLLYLPH